MTNWNLDNGFNSLTQREQMNKRTATLNAIAQQYGPAVADSIKYLYDWRNMSPAWIMQAAQSRDWGK